jgi:hypothetical protein
MFHVGLFSSIVPYLVLVVAYLFYLVAWVFNVPQQASLPDDTEKVETITSGSKAGICKTVHYDDYRNNAPQHLAKTALPLSEYSNPHFYVIPFYDSVGYIRQQSVLSFHCYRPPPAA